MAPGLTVVPGGIMLTNKPYNSIPFRVLSIFIELLRIIFITLPLINICNYITIQISIRYDTPWSFYAGPGFLYPTLKWLHGLKWNDPLLIALLTPLLVFTRRTLADIRQAEMSECILFVKDSFLIATETLLWIRHKRSLSIQEFSMDDVDNVSIRQGYFWNKKLVIRFKGGRKEIVVFRELHPEMAILADVLEVMRNEINFEMRKLATDNN